MPACQCCNLKESKRLELDREILQGKAYSMLANKYGVNWQSVRYHAENHLSHQLRTAYEKKAALEGLDLLSEIEELIRRTKRILDRAESENKLNTALNAIGQARGSYELLSKIAFSLHQARIAELELERERSQETNKEESEAFAKQALDNLTLEEADLLLRLTDKANGLTDEVIIPGKMLTSMDVDIDKPRKKKQRMSKPAWLDEPVEEDPEPAFKRTKEPPKNSVKPIPSETIPSSRSRSDFVRAERKGS